MHEIQKYDAINEREKLITWRYCQIVPVSLTRVQYYKRDHQAGQQEQWRNGMDGSSRIQRLLCSSYRAFTFSDDPGLAIFSNIHSVHLKGPGLGDLFGDPPIIRSSYTWCPPCPDILG